MPSASQLERHKLMSLWRPLNEHMNSVRTRSIWQRLCNHCSEYAKTIFCENLRKRIIFPPKVVFFHGECYDFTIEIFFKNWKLKFCFLNKSRFLGARKPFSAALVRATATSAPTASNATAVADEVGYHRPVRQIEASPVRHGFIPEEW